MFPCVPIGLITDETRTVLSICLDLQSFGFHCCFCWYSIQSSSITCVVREITNRRPVKEFSYVVTAAVTKVNNEKPLSCWVSRSIDQRNILPFLIQLLWSLFLPFVKFLKRSLCLFNHSFPSWLSHRKFSSTITLPIVSSPWMLRSISFSTAASPIDFAQRFVRTSPFSVNTARITSDPIVPSKPVVVRRIQRRSKTCPIVTRWSINRTIPFQWLNWIVGPRIRVTKPTDDTQHHSLVNSPSRSRQTKSSGSIVYRSYRNSPQKVRRKALESNVKKHSDRAAPIR